MVSNVVRKVRSSAKPAGSSTLRLLNYRTAQDPQQNGETQFFPAASGRR